MATIYLVKGFGRTAEQESVSSAWTNIYTSGNYSLSGKASAVVGYNRVNGRYEISSVSLQIKRSSTAFPNGLLTIKSKSVTSSTFSPSSFSSISAPNGSSFPLYSSTRDIGTSGTTVIVYGNGVSGGSTSAVSWNSTKSFYAVLKSTFQITYKPDSTKITSDISVNIEVTLTGAGTKCSLTYIKEDGTQSGSTISGAYGTTTSIKSGYSKNSVIDKDNGVYTVYFDSRGGSSVDSKSLNWSWSQQISYTFSSWGNYTPGSTYTYTVEDNSLKAKFSSSAGEKIWNYPKLGGLQTTYKLGYNKTNVWYYSDGSIASSSDTITSSKTLHVEWDPKIYKISFNLDGGKMPEEYGKISDYTVEKTYGVNSAKTPSFTPTKVGYKFIGWRNQAKTSTLIGINSTIDDSAYNKANTAQTNSNVTLYAQWEYNKNILKFYYFVNDNKVTNEYLEYNINSTEVKKYSPNRVNEMGGDYVFLGWCIELPENYGWDTAADPSKQGYHGIYTNPLDIPKGRNTPQYPAEVDVSKLKNLDDWGKTQVYYGVWSKTGKYIKIGNRWRKASSLYVKINGIWKVVTDVWTRKNDAWVKEI